MNSSRLVSEGLEYDRESPRVRIGDILVTESTSLPFCGPHG